MRNKELYAVLLHTGYTARARTFFPNQVSIIVRYLDGS